MSSEIDTLNSLLEKVENSSDERKMFLAVVFQAILDSTKPPYKGEPITAVEDRDEARRWFLCSVGVTADDFKTICDLAGLDSTYTKGFAISIFEGSNTDYVRRRINTIF